MAVLGTLLRGAEREGEREVARLGGLRRRVRVLASFVERPELCHVRRALRREVLRERARKTLSRTRTVSRQCVYSHRDGVEERGYPPPTKHSTTMAIIQ